MAVSLGDRPVGGVGRHRLFLRLTLGPLELATAARVVRVNRDPPTSRVEPSFNSMGFPPLATSIPSTQQRPSSSSKISRARRTTISMWNASPCSLVGRGTSPGRLRLLGTAGTQRCVAYAHGLSNLLRGACVSAHPARGFPVTAHGRTRPPRCAGLKWLLRISARTPPPSCPSRQPC